MSSEPITQAGSSPASAARTIYAKGVAARSPLCLYNPGPVQSIVLWSIYGAPQQTRAMSAMLVSYWPITVMDDAHCEMQVMGPLNVRMRGRSIGTGKHSLLIWDEYIRDRYLVWTDPAFKTQALRSALETRKIPYDPAWLYDMERILVDEGFWTPLEGWGGNGYRADWNDDRICDLLAKRYGLKALAKAV